MKIGKSKLFEGIILLGIVLIGVQFINSPALFVFLLGAVALLYSATTKAYMLPLEFFTLAVAFTAYFIIYRSYRDSIPLYCYAVYWWGPIIGYYVGYSIVRIAPQKERKPVVQKVLFAICLGTTLFATGCIVKKAIHIDMYNKAVTAANLYWTMTQRYALNMWSNELIHPTNLNSMCVFIVLLLFYVLNYVKNKRVRVCYWIGLACTLVIAMVTATRTNFVLIPIAFVLSMFLSRREIDIHLTKRKMAVIICALYGLFLCSWKIVEKLQNSLMATRTESLDNGRLSSIIRVLDGLQQYPMGNMPYSSAHNMWADVARVTGYVPMIALVLYTVMIMFTLFRLLRRHCIEQKVKTLFAVLTIGMLISFSIEPAIEGRPYNVMFFCMINGMCRAFVQTRFDAEPVRDDAFALKER